MMLAPLILLAALTDPRPAIVALPFQGSTTHAAALSSAVDGALFSAATARGMRPARIDAVLGVKEQLAGCADDACRATTTRRLGARYVVTGVVTDAEMRLFVLDESGARVAGIGIAGNAPTLLAQVPKTVDALLETVAPKNVHVRADRTERGQRARARGDFAAADALFREAIAAGALNDDAADLFLARVRMLDAAALGFEAAACWDELAATFGEGAGPAALLTDAKREQMQQAIDDHVRGLAGARLLVD
jgi:hypothetical protein